LNSNRKRQQPALHHSRILKAVCKAASARLVTFWFLALRQRFLQPQSLLRFRREPWLKGKLHTPDFLLQAGKKFGA
jgi:hypothetical protein